MYIHDINKLISKTDCIKPFSQSVKFFYVKDVNNTTENRMKKYMEKGFNINLHEKYDEILEKISTEVNKYSLNKEEPCEIMDNLLKIMITYK